jgi:uncharacterized protein YyaL (SSP411 family)
MPSAYTQMMMALDFAFGLSYEVVIAGDENQPDTIAMLQAIRSRFFPNKIVLLRPSKPSEPKITRLAEYTMSQTSLRGKATAYVCLNFSCKQPTTDIVKLLELLNIKNTGQ